MTDFSSALAEAAARTGPSVIGLGRGWGLGSGVVIAPQRVLTVAHRVRSDQVSVKFADGRSTEGRLLAADGDADLAVVEADTGDVPPLALADAEHPDVAIGTPVIALANPGGRGLRATPGFVVAEPRSLRGPRGRRISGGIEHTAPLPRGSGGGPLVSLDGTLLGVNAIRLDGGLVAALPADATFRRRVERLSEGERAETPRLGVAVAPPRVARRLRVAVGLPERDGLLVRAVEDDSPAARAGIEPGDLLVRAGERELDGIDALHDAMEAGGELRLGVVRGVEERELTVALS